MINDTQPSMIQMLLTIMHDHVTAEILLSLPFHEPARWKSIGPGSPHPYR